MKIALLGGSFNPIHIGHLALADEVCTALGYDRLLFVPAWKAPHKEADSRCVDGASRLEMVRLACEGDARFGAESCEIEREGISYTFDTLCQLEKKYASVLSEPLGLVLGADLFSGFHLWYKATEIVQKAQLILAVRPHRYETNAEFAARPTQAYKDVEALPFALDDEPLFDGAVRIQNPALAVSSTEIRARIAEGRSFRYLVPQKVFDYIRDRKMYAKNHP